MEPAADPVGRILGEFTLKERIGQGAFGAVFRAVQTSLGREAVVKILQPKSGGAAGTAKLRFLREARLASRLDHPFAAHIYAFGAEDDGTLWIAMELVRGTSLADLLRAQGQLPVDRAIPLLERICEVVENAHEHGIVHRDLKPANIMIITRGGRLFPKLLDLGLAKIVDAPEEPARSPQPLADTIREDDRVAVTQRGAYIGTPLYMAPEQWTQATVDARADQYALGCVAYECLVGKPPFVGRSVIEVARAHQSAPLPPLPAGLPDKIAGVLARAVAKKAPERWESVLRFAAALRDAAGLGGDSPLPEVDEALRRVAQDAPTPVAEAAAAIEAARNPHEARDAVLRTVRVTLRWLAIIGLAGRTRGGVESVAAGQVVADLLRELRKRELDEGDWLQLLEGLVKPYAERPELHAIPELVRAVSAGIPARLARVADEIAPTREALARAYGELSMALREMTFLRDYPLVVPRGTSAEIWMGARRANRPSVELATPVPDGEGKPVIADADRRPVLVLWPLAQLATPSPGAPEELFLLEGYGRRGARLVGGAVGFERQDEGVWDYFRQSILDESLADSGPRLEVAPYRGLAPFTAEDARMFYGREREAEAFSNRLKVQSLLVVAGPSGVGKSSFVQAGVAPSLPEGSTVVVIRPGSTPLATLEARVSQPPALLLVDQFEELFTLTGDPAEREAFAARLVALSREGARVVLTVRDDFLARAAELPSLRDRVTQGLHLLTTPAEEDLLRILMEPARRAGYEFDPRDLPDKMVAEVAGRPGALALLSFTASKLWDARDRHFRRLSGAAYDTMGGVGGALARHADETLAGLPAAEQRLVREAFRHLVTSEGTRAVLTPAELRQLLGGGPAAERVIETLINARLLVADEERVEIIHEALVVAWPRLVEWRREDADGSRFRDQLRTAVKAWQERGRPQGLLWRGDALADYQRWRSGYTGALTDSEEAFAAASLLDARKARTRRRGLIVAALLGLSIAVIVLFFFYRRADDAATLATAKEAEAKQSAAEARGRMLDSYEEQGRQYFVAGDVLRAIPVLREVWKSGRRDVALRYLLARGRQVVGQESMRWYANADVVTVILSPDEKLVAAGTRAGRVRVWDRETGKRRWDLTADDSLAIAVAFSPDGKILATGGGGGHVRLWEVATGRLLREMKHDDRVYSVGFSPDGAALVSASWDRTGRLWRVADGARLGTLPQTAKLDVAAFLPGGREILTADNEGNVILWDAATLRKVRSIKAFDDRARELRSSSDGRRLVLLGQRRAPISWDPGSEQEPVSLRHESDVLSIDLSLDGKTVLTGASDHFARLWDAATGRLEGSILTPAPVRQVRFCSDSAFVTGADDGTIQLWSRQDGSLLDELVGHDDQVYALDCTADGRVLISGSWDETVRVWPMLPTRRTVLPTGDSLVYGFDVSSRGDRWVTTRPGGDTTLWEDGSASSLRAWPTTADGSRDVRFSPDGQRILTVNEKPPYVRIWSVERHEAPISLAETAGPVGRAIFRPDGKVIVTGGVDGMLRFWEIASGRELSAVRAHEGQINSLAFSPDATKLLSSSNDQTAAVWEVATGRELHRLRGHASYVQSAGYDEAGDWIVTASSDRTARIWDATSGAAVMALEGSPNELMFALLANGLALTGSSTGDVRVWDPGSGRLLEVLSGAPFSVKRIVVRSGWVVAGTNVGLVRWELSLVDANDGISWSDGCRIPYSWDNGKLHTSNSVRCAEGPLN